MSPRPALPLSHLNPYLPPTLQSPSLPPVKYQILNCQGQDILVGRLKILTNTGSGHAFILRRFDTGAISVTTMFRAAFPNATELDEKTEINWIKEHYDLAGNNGSIRDQHIARLAGVWVSPDVALDLGAEYNLGSLINVIVDAHPDPNANYRRSGKSAMTTGASVTSSPQLSAGGQQQQSYITPPTTSSPQQTALAPAAKRRKESSPGPTTTTTTTSSPVSNQNQLPPRRSVRTKSPAPRSTVQPFSAVVVPRTPKPFKTAAAVAARREETLVVTPGGSEETIVEEHEEIKVDTQKVIDHVAGDELREQDIHEQKELIEKLKAQREAAAAAVEEQEGEEGEEGEEEEEEEQQGERTTGKRAREDEEAPLQFQFREPQTEERPIATNNRVEKWRLNPGTKRVAWGVAAFAAGLGAVLLPTFF